MNILILGSGSATPTLTRNPTAQLLEVSGRLFLIDCGESTQISLLRKKIPLLKINHIFISHLHGDHWLGLPGLISSMHLGGRTEPLHLFCPKGLDEILSIIFNHSDTHLQFQINYHFHSTDSKQLIWENSFLEIFSFPLLHKIQCNGFLFQEKPKLRNLRREAIEIHHIPVEDMMAIKAGSDWINSQGHTIPNALLTTPPKPSSSYAFCSDTAFHPKLNDYIHQVKVLYHEATFTQELESRAQSTFHSTANQAAQMASLIETQTLLLGHFSSRYKDTTPFLAEAKNHFPNTMLVYDGFNLDF
ncbi:MAG: ribonuclease Z [Bacteroidia bacterium]|nr:ribonuclease Z [Bacteroidia bacterium]